jgi:hypothetical protein
VDSYSGFRFSIPTCLLLASPKAWAQSKASYVCREVGSAVALEREW